MIDSVLLDAMAEILEIVMAEAGGLDALTNFPQGDFALFRQQDSLLLSIVCGLFP